MIQHLDALLVTSRQIESRKGEDFVLKTNALIMLPLEGACAKTRMSTL